jgi:hypothetical protein
MGIALLADISRSGRKNLRQLNDRLEGKARITAEASMGQE